MNLGSLRTEVLARGFDYVTDSRVNQWINRAYQRVCDRHAWPFLETTTTGAAPLTISDVRAVLSVLETDNDHMLEWEDFRTVREMDPTLAATGTAESWYLDGSALRVYPLSTATLSVRYIKVPAELTADTDSPLLPSRYHLLLVDFAVAEGYKDSDNLEAYSVLRGDVEEQIREMENAILVPNYDSPANMIPGGGFHWE